MANKDIAKLRGERAGKLFSKIDFDDIINAINKEELHRTNPAVNPSGRDDFYNKCWEAVTKDKDTKGDPSYGISDWELAAFIDDLWNATWASRKAQELKPCW